MNQIFLKIRDDKRFLNFQGIIMRITMKVLNKFFFAKFLKL